MKPVIGITVDCAPDPSDNRTRGLLKLNWNYAQAVADAGGTPLLIPPQVAPEDLVDLLDGLLIPGGDDIDAKEFGEANHPAVKTIAAERFEGERRLFAKLNPEMPVLGICYGCQFINVMRGGTLHQHLPDIVGHDADIPGTSQSYEVAKDSHLACLVGSTKVEGQSWHHQAVNQVGASLKVVAKNEDGTVEALEATDRPWLIGVQWHPERTLEDEATKRLFKEFITAATEYRGRK